MNRVSLKTISPDLIGQGSIVGNDTYLRRDIYRFMNYIFEYGLQRSYRNNEIPKGPAKKLAKILSYKDEMAYVEGDNCGYWSDFISQLARGMKLADFDTEGKYMGYSSSSPSYPDNYIEPKEESWKKYLAMNSLAKEWAIMDGLQAITENEFHHRPTLAPDDERFYTRGSAINAASKMNLSLIRSSLMSILSQLEPDVWYSFSDLVAYIKENHFNLIIDHKNRDRHTEKNIYSYFFEYPIKNNTQDWRNEREIQENQPDAFERVEGRYLAFFLEEIPFIMGFVNLAYAKEQPQTVTPYYGHLQAFSLTPKFFMVYRKDPSYNQVSVTIQANHEVVVQYTGYAELEYQFFQNYGQILQDDRILIFRPDKKKIADRVAGGEDIMKLIQKFQSLSSSSIPQNILTEMESWGSHGEKITLYRGYSLLEIEKKRLRELSQLDQAILDHIEKDITPNIFLIRDSERVFQYLDKYLYLPDIFSHALEAFLYYRPTHSGLKGIQAEKKAKKTCEISFQELKGLSCTKKEILVQIQEQFQKKNIQTHLFLQQNLLLVPIAFSNSLETEAKKAIEKNNMEVKILT